MSRFAGDGGYDKRKVYGSLNKHAPEAEVLIPPRKNARIWQHANTKAERLRRDENLRAVRKSGRKAWKQSSGYHVRSLPETRNVSSQNHFWRSLVCSLDGDASHTSLSSMRCTQSHDPSGYA